MSYNPNIFCLTNADGKFLPPAVQATVLAKYSRSPDSARDIVKNLSEEEADKFQSKWTNAYNHSSIADLAEIPLCFEGVSIIASKFIESFQRAGYSEKSTRYQKFSENSFVSPPGSPEYLKKFVSRFYGTYDELSPLLYEMVSKKVPPGTSDRAIKARVFDNLRYLLPAGTGTNIGMVADARDIRYLISSAMAHPNPEIKAIGELTRKAVEQVCPVFVSDVKSDYHHMQTKDLGPIPHAVVGGLFGTAQKDGHVYMIEDPSMGHISNQDIEEKFYSLVRTYGESKDSFEKIMQSRGERHVPRVFRNFRFKFDVFMDFGAYRDLQRHRRCEIYPELHLGKHGFIIPDDIIGTPLENLYCNDMVESTMLTHSVDDTTLQYVLPIGHIHRSHFDMDLAQLYYIAELRTKPQGHISYRRIAYDMYRLASEKFPFLMQWCKPTRPDEIGEHK